MSAPNLNDCDVAIDIHVSSQQNLTRIVLLPMWIEGKALATEINHGQMYQNLGLFPALLNIDVEPFPKIRSQVAPELHIKYFT